MQPSIEDLVALGEEIESPVSYPADYEKGRCLICKTAVEPKSFDPDDDFSNIADRPRFTLCEEGCKEVYNLAVFLYKAKEDMKERLAIFAGFIKYNMSTRIIENYYNDKFLVWLAKFQADYDEMFKVAYPGIVVPKVFDNEFRICFQAKRLRYWLDEQKGRNIMKKRLNGLLGGRPQADV